MVADMMTLLATGGHHGTVFNVPRKKDTKSEHVWQIIFVVDPPDYYPCIEFFSDQDTIDSVEKAPKFNTHAWTGKDEDIGADEHEEL
jgi:hypothetical protein